MPFSLANTNDETVVWAINIILVIIIVYIIWYSVWYSVMKSWECSTMNKLYNVPNGKIQPISSQFDHLLRDYYIKTAYNCCSGGGYRNDYVDTCSLEAVIRDGARCLDMEIYSINDIPVISTSATGDICAKETFNSVPFAEVMKTISYNAMGSMANCPNPSDPLILHLRVKSGNVKMYNNMATILESYNSMLLGKEFSFENRGKNLGETPITSLMKKIVIIVDRTNNAFLESQTFREYVNLTSSSIFMRALHYHDIKYAPDTTELTEFNKKFMTIGMPDKGSNPSNPSGIVMRETGCQFLGMRFQTTDTYLKETLEFFDLAGYAFVLKPERLRYTPITVPTPKKQDPKLSYATREIDGGFYKFTI